MSGFKSRQPGRAAKNKQYQQRGGRKERTVREVGGTHGTTLGGGAEKKRSRKG